MTRRSGTSIRGEYVSHAGNKRFKRAMFFSAFASLRSDPVSRAYYDRKITQGKAPWAKPSSPWPTAASSPCTP
ncbi:Transposase IS116/IS110/IS902 family protein [Actinomyces denticolens]|uniref:Transposase IS116/IS110/IS902 family protein n=1 Tax=Actinomyces denticolens TaxID=52767 RepID=A0ABY1IBI3_9ACTO|nr:Transposase IS116/IS110/IS902 family protein [Actinomyces denticolens]